MHYRNEWYNGGGLGPAGWDQGEWCHKCHTYEHRLKFQNGQIENDPTRTNICPWWIDRYNDK